MRRATFVAAVALAAALLFVVQPMVARFLLPVVGGSTLVWSTALVFFQVALLVGYLVAHVVARVPGQRAGFVVVLALAGLGALPFALPEAEPDWSAPTSWVFTQLVVMVAAPFVLLAGTSPLLQSWYSRTPEPDAHEPYRLYAASNAGSIVGLLAYPFVVERFLSLEMQAALWAAGFAVLVMVVASAAAYTPQGAPVAASASSRPERGRALWWVVCAAIPSALLVTMTSNITSDIAPVPLLWVVPLAVYLASHVWVFSSRAPRHESAEAAVVLFVLPYGAFAFFDYATPWWFFAPLAVVILGIAAVAYHGELVRTRPAPEHLTAFYLWMSAGGALGGAFATFVAPMMFDTLVELRLELIGAAIALPWVRRTVARRWVLSLAFIGAVCGMAILGGEEPDTVGIALAFVLVVFVASQFAQRRELRGAELAGFAALFVVVGMFFDPLLAARSAYGRYRIDRVQSELGEFHDLIVGRVSHGVQARDEELRALPLAYYHPAGPLGQVLRSGAANGPLCGIGLGIGAMAEYASPVRPVTFIELDPLVVEIAKDTRFFTHLQRCAHCRVEVGDGRVALRAEKDGAFAVLVVDAFSGDAIPTHMLTVEAFELYKRKLRPGGLILVHASNSYVDIAAVLANLGAATGLAAARQDYWPREAYLRQLQVKDATWVLLSEDEAVVRGFTDDPRWKAMTTGDATKAWTDDWQNLFAHYSWQ